MRSKAPNLNEWLTKRFGKDEAKKLLLPHPKQRVTLFERAANRAQHRLEKLESEIKDLAKRELMLAEAALELSQASHSSPSQVEQAHFAALKIESERAMLLVQDYRTRLIVEAGHLREKVERMRTPAK